MILRITSVPGHEDFEQRPLITSARSIITTVQGTLNVTER